MRRLVVTLALLALGAVLVPFAPGVGADEPTLVASAEVQSYALRVEYDIPLPLSAGTIPEVVGDVRRSGAGENAQHSAFGRAFCWLPSGFALCFCPPPVAPTPSDSS